MRFSILIFLLIVFISCQKKQESIAIDKSLNASFFSIENGVLYFKEKKYTGKLFELGLASDTISKVTYYNGLEHGVLKKWYSNGQLKEYREYSEGAKHGPQESYWENGRKRFEFEAKNDAYHGEMKQWNRNGVLTQLSHFVNGHEEGVQKMWNLDGSIRSNYIIKNGRRYGLLGTKNCINATADSGL